MDESLIGANGRVSFYFIYFLQHIAEFKHVFEHFATQAANTEKKQKEDTKGDSDEEEDAFTKTDKKVKKEEKQMSKKQRKLLARMKVFDLKMRVRRPDMVEAWDVTANDPNFLMDMKMVRNSVPVPRHWCQKRRYLQYKRGVHKTPFKLPDFIEQTGITKVRE